MRDERERGWRRKKTRMTKEERIKENRDWKQRKKDRKKVETITKVRKQRIRSRLDENGKGRNHE